MLIENAVNSYMGATPSPDPEPEWQPPTDWIPVPEPGDYELYFLVAKEGSFAFGCHLYDPDFSYNTECTVDWGDGTIENFDKNNRPEHSYTSGGMFLVKIVTDGDPCLFNGFSFGSPFSAPVLIAKFGDEILTNNEANGGSVFYRCTSYIKQIKIGGKDGIQAYEFDCCKNLQKFDSTIPLNVIPKGAFNGCYSLKNIDLSHVKSIGEYAFRECRNLNCDIDIPYIDSIKEETFYNCYKIKRINATNLTTIGNRAFTGCINLKKINAPNLTTVGDYAFSTCNGLNNISMPNVISIGSGAFQNCVILQTVDFSNLTEIKNNTFCGCYALRTINAPEVTTVGNNAFEHCRSLDVIDLPKVTSFGEDAAAYSAVIKVNMPACTSIGNYAFSYCYNLDSPKNFVLAKNCTFGINCFYDVWIYPPIA